MEQDSYLMKRIEANDALSKAFENETVWDASPEELKSHLRTLHTHNIPNETVRHRAIIQALTINHIQMARLIASLEEKNKITQRWFMFIAIGTLIISALSLYLK